MKQLPYVLRNEWIKFRSNKWTLQFILITPWLGGGIYPFQPIIMVSTIIFVIYANSDHAERSKVDTFTELLPIKKEVLLVANYIIVFSIVNMIASYDMITAIYWPYMFPLTILAFTPPICIMLTLNILIGEKNSFRVGFILILGSVYVSDFFNDTLSGITPEHWIQDSGMLNVVSCVMYFSLLAVSYFVVKKAG
ncbi:MAG: hypothetical protein ACRCWQ_14450 [Bacilli bacterium]